MAYINLLPWREDALKDQQKKFFSVLSLVALFSCAITLSVSFFYQAKIDGQKTKNNFLKNGLLFGINLTASSLEKFCNVGS